MCECGLERETVQHYFLNCSPFAAQRSVLLTSAAQLCGQAWIESGDSEKLLLHGCENLSYRENSFSFSLY
jgi:hypothetical protein